MLLVFIQKIDRMLQHGLDHLLDDRLVEAGEPRIDDEDDEGLRIDLMMCSASVADRVRWCVIDRNARKGKQPSDHAPVVIDVAD